MSSSTTSSHQQTPSSAASSLHDQEDFSLGATPLYPLSSSQLQEIERIYNSLKTSHQLMLKTAHLETVLHLVGLCPTKHQLHNYKKMIGRNQFSLSECIDLVAYAINERLSFSELYEKATKCFMAMADDRMRLSLSKLHQVLCMGTADASSVPSRAIGETLSVRDFHRLLNENEISSSALDIGLDQFLKLMCVEENPLLGI